MIPFISNLFNLPVTRKEVLKRAKKYKCFGLCYAIDEALKDYEIYYMCIRPIFPLFNIDNAKRFGAVSNNAFWWTMGDWEN